MKLWSVVKMEEWMEKIIEKAVEDYEMGDDGKGYRIEDKWLELEELNKLAEAVAKEQRRRDEEEFKGNICRTCGFDKNLKREPVLLNSNILSLVSANEDRCEECEHMKDGWSIIGDNPIGRLNKYWKEVVSKVRERAEKRTAENIKKEITTLGKDIDKTQTETTNQGRRQFHEGGRSACRILGEMIGYEYLTEVDKMEDEDGFPCPICGKDVDETKTSWHWAEEPAHMECVLKEANVICEDCGYLTIEGTEDTCYECDGKLRPLTEEDKQKFREKEKKG